MGDVPFREKALRRKHVATVTERHPRVPLARYGFTNTVTTILPIAERASGRLTEGLLNDSASALLVRIEVFRR